MALPRVLILGAGFGGLSAAHTFRQEVGDGVELLVVDQSQTFLMGLRKLWILDGRAGAGEGTRSRSTLERAGIPFRQGTVEAIDLDRRRVQVDGSALGFDYLIVALGAQPRADLTPGDLGDTPVLYTLEGAQAAGERLRALDRGRVVIAITGVPYKCPPAPYEAAFLIDDLLRRTGRRDAVEMQVLTPQPMSMPAAGPATCAQVEGRLKTQDIRFRPLSQTEDVRPGRLTLSGGDIVEAEVLILVPPNRPPSVVRESGLTGDGDWVQVDPSTLATEHQRIYAIGDVVEMQTGAGLPFPKAGVFAERHGEVVARNIAAAVADRAPSEEFEGFGYCFLEVGGGAASMVRGNFLAQPPAIEIGDAAPEHLESKEAFERDRLARWFPG